MDALDTLYIMEMFEEFDSATAWVEKNLDFNVVRMCVHPCVGQVQRFSRNVWSSPTIQPNKTRVTELGWSELPLFAVNNGHRGPLVKDMHYAAKSIHSPIQLINFRCSNPFHGHRCVDSSTSASRLLLQTSVKEWVGEFQRGTVIGCHLCNEFPRY